MEWRGELPFKAELPLKLQLSKSKVVGLFEDGLKHTAPPERGALLLKNERLKRVKLMAST